ncbi:putative Atrial natriuretic peptide receptor 1 [Hypsibius exemplaris]|uniref:Atrial natriuretic peptide receptor 1 n=1 Tax=Hypsibius exemplaris TaxID=2072580 RepID=A0A1W0X652_HYPEX|nr:putative Atrial natriuretic peptide receptor 1 [Hypsibius exemplaris]
MFVLGLVAYSAETIIPAIELAARESNQLYGSQVTFNHSVIGNPKSGDFCDQFQEAMTSQLAEFYYRRRSRSYFLLLPTGCSPSIVQAAGLAREWNVPVISSGGGGDALRNKKLFPSLVCLLPSTVEEYTRTFFAIMQRNQWHTVTFICNSDSSKNYFFRSACQQFPAILKRQVVPFTVYDYENNLSQEYSRTSALKKARAQSRIIVILAHMDLVRLTLVTAFRLGMTNNNYVYLTSVWYNFNNPELGSPHWFRNDSLDTVALEAFKSLLIITLSSPRQSQRLRDFFSAIDSISRKNNVTVDYKAPNAIPKAEGQLYAIFAHAAFHAAAQMVNESIANGADLNNGIDFAQRMYGRSYSSLEGHSFVVNANGDRDSLYAVLAITTEQGDLQEILLYDASKRDLYPSPSGHNWVRAESIPRDRPECGFHEDSSGCHADEYTTVLASTLVVVAILLLVGITVLIKRYRNAAWRTCPYNLNSKDLVVRV